MLAYRYLGWTLVVYGVGYALAPIEPSIDVAPRSLWLWLASAAMSMAGLSVASWLQTQWQPALERPSFSLHQASVRLNLLAALGLLFTLIDR